MPTHQIRKLLAGSAKISPSKSNTSSSKTSTPKRNKPAKETQSETKKTKQEQGPKQPPKPKSLDQAFKALTPEAFATQLEHYQLLFPGSKLSWLKAVRNKWIKLG